jgi:hypothetical protein
LAGAAAAAAVAGSARAASAPSKRYHLDFADKARRQVVVLRDISKEREPKKEADPPDLSPDEFLLSWDRRDFGPNAWFKIARRSASFIDESSRNAASSDASEIKFWIPVEWTLTVNNASFPGLEGKEFRTDFKFYWEKGFDWRVSATATPWWPSKSKLFSAKAINLDEFLNGETRLAFKVGRGDSDALLRGLFGERIEARTALELRVDRQLVWSIDAGARAARANSAARVGRFYILDVPLEFGGMTLSRIRGDEPFASERKAGAAGGESAPANGQPNGDKRTEERLFEAEVIHGRPARNGAARGALRPDGLYGAIYDISGFTELNRATREPEDVALKWSFDFATKRLAERDTAVVFALDKQAVSFGGQALESESQLPKVAAAIRHWGYPQHTVAGCAVSPGDGARSIGRISLRQGAGDEAVVEGPFEFAGFEFVRQHRDKAKAVVTRLSVTPASKEMSVDLQLGRLCVAALPATGSRPGVGPRVPAIVVEATEPVGVAEKGRRVLKSFHGRLALCSAAIKLPERIDAAMDNKPAAVVAGTHVTRLGFHDADAAFYLPALNAAPVSSADAVVPLGPPIPDGKAVFDFGRAHLSVLRPSDLLALKFRFSGLELVTPWPPVIDKAAELLPRGGRAPGRPYSQTDGPATPRDERPLMVVEFPPQHVVERAYFRQIPQVPDLPQLSAKPFEGCKGGEEKELLENLKRALSAPKQWSSPPQSEADASMAQRWRKWVAELLGQCPPAPDDVVETSRDERIKLRQEIQKLAHWSDQALFPNSPDKKKKGKDFDERFKLLAAGLPEEQRFYVGPDFLDPDARRIAHQVMRELRALEYQGQAPAPSAAAWPLVNDIPERDWTSIFQPFVASADIPPADLQSQSTWPSLEQAGKYKAVVAEVERAREQRDREYAAFRSRYAMLAREYKLPDDRQEYFGPKWLDGVLAANREVLKEFQEKLLAALPTSYDEPFDSIVPARLSGPSRIAFRVDCEDYEPDRPAGRIPFTLEGLTDWGGMDMAVVRRAERLMEPLPGGTRLPPRWERRARNDDGEILRFQGFTSSERWGRFRETRRREPATAAVTAMQRLAEVFASSAQAPDAFETAIELPFRLFLSPAQDATWITAAPRVRRHAGLPDEVDAFRELWTARLAGSGQAAAVRAVWSPDYRPEALLSTQAPGAPPMGPYAPWALSRAYGLRKSPPASIEQFRTGLDAFDRHELVVLSSVHGLPVLGRRAPSGDLAPDADQIEPPEGFRLQGLLTEETLPEEANKQTVASQRPVAAANRLPVDMTAIYRPKPLSIGELSLSALGGNLDVDAGFQPPASARALSTKRNLFDALSIERWKQRTVLGRDIVVEVVYKGFLFPLGHRASLVKLTERRFESVEGSPTAILVQRLFLRVGKPEKRFPAEGQANRGCRWPCDRITILTRQTPDLVDARSDTSLNGAPPFVTPRGLIKLGASEKTTGLCMWPRTAARDGAEVWFEMQVGDEAVPVRMPLIFVDNAAANDEDTVAALIDYYHKVSIDPNVSPTRKLLRNGHPVVMAPEYKPNDTTFETQWWRVGVEGRELTLPVRDPEKGTILKNSLYRRDSFMEGQDQPPFYPLVDTAYCRLKTVERFTGSGPLWAEVTFDGEYVEKGFVDDENKEREQQSEIYLRVLKGARGDTVELDFSDRGDLGGGVARPTMDVVALSRSLGPIHGGAKAITVGDDTSKADKSPPSPPTTPQPPGPLPVLERINRFKDSINILPKGKFLGIMELSQLVEKVLGVKLHPKLTEVIEYGSASLAEGAAGAIAGAASDVRSALTKTIIAAAVVAVTEVRKAWEELAKKRLGVDSAPTLNEIYPQVGVDLGALEQLLIKAQSPAVSDAEFFSLLAAIHEAARRLIRTIEGIARDPLAAAAGAQLAIFQTLLKPIDDVRQKIVELGQLLDLPEQLRKLVRDFAASAVLRLAELGSVSDQAGAAVENAIKESLLAENFAAKLAERLEVEAETVTVAAERAALKEAAKKIKAAAEKIEALRAAAEQTEKRLIALRDEAKEAGDAALENLAAQLAQTASEAKRRAVEAAAEILLSPTGARVLHILIDAAEAWARLPKPPLDPEKIGEFLTGLISGSELLAVIGQNRIVAGLLNETGVVELCAAVKRALETGAAAMLPAVKNVEDATKTLGDATTTVRNALDAIKDEPTRNSFNAAASSLLRAMEKLRDAIKALNDKITAISSTTCARPPKELVDAVRDATDEARLASSEIRNLLTTTLGVFDKESLKAIGDEEKKKAVVTLIDALFDLLLKLAEVAQNLTVLGKAPEAFNAFAEALTALAKALAEHLPRTSAQLEALATEQRSRDPLEARKKALEAVRAQIKSLADAYKASREIDTPKFKEAADGAKQELLLALEAALARLERALAADLYDLIAPAIAEAGESLTELLSAAQPATKPILDTLVGLYRLAVDQRNAVQKKVDNATAVAKVFDALARALGAGDTRHDLLRVYAPGKKDPERLEEEERLAKLAISFWNAHPQAAMAKLGELADAWRDHAALPELIRRFTRVKSSFLRAVVVEALDLRGLRRELDRIVRELVPTRVQLSYDLSTPVREFKLNGVGKVFIPVKGTRLDIKTRASIDLLNPKAPEARIDGHMGAFGIQLFGDFDVVLLNFRGLDFRAGAGRPSGFDVRFGDFVIGSKAKFLKQLEPYVSPKAGLPPVRLMKDKPGIEATYGVNLGSFGVGTLSFSNVTLNAGARLPFGKGEEAEFIVSIGRSDAPFLISSTIFGGGGYLALLANGKGFIGLETSFDYGGVFTFGFGPLSGTGQITLGLYFRAARGEPAQLGMNFMARGAANIACFSFATSLFVRLTYIGGQMQGQATYTFSFSIGIDDIEFRIDVYVNQGGSAGKGSTAFLDLPGMPRTRFADARPGDLDAFAQAGGVAGAQPASKRMLRVRAPSQKSNWNGYRGLFDANLKPVVNF